MNEIGFRVDDLLCHALYSATHAVVQLYRELLAPWGLTYQQVLVLGLLWQQPRMTPGEIADALHLDSSSVAGLLKRLEQAELIERAIDPSDRRRIQVRTTRRSEELRDELGWIEECVTGAYGMSAEASKDLISRLHDVRTRVRAYSHDPEAELRRGA